MFGTGKRRQDIEDLHFLSNFTSIVNIYIFCLKLWENVKYDVILDISHSTK